MNRSNTIACVFTTIMVLARLLCAQQTEAPALPQNWSGVLIGAEEASTEQLNTFREQGFQAVALVLTASQEDAAERESQAAQRIADSGLQLYYWIEIGRCPELADAHPRWMASLQGHPEWHRLFPDVAEPKDDQVIKAYPWIPILYQEAWDAHQERVARLLADRPKPAGIFLNDLQGAPSACGCGNILCRWTTDYGPIVTATRLGDDAAAQFVAAVRKQAPGSNIIPVWTTECEEHDLDGPCAGVGCFEGTCWVAYTKQLMPLAEQAPLIGVLLPLRDFDRDLPVYERPAGWIYHALKTFETMPPQRKGKAISTNRLLAVLQGWDVTAEQLESQIARSKDAKAAGYLVARYKIDQSWTPKLLDLND